MVAVRGLEGWLRQRQLVRKEPFDALKGMRIGVDAFQWIRASTFLDESLSSALGGRLLALEKNVAAELAELHGAEVTPLVVFGGLAQSKKTKSPLASSRAKKFLEKRQDAWKAFESGKLRTAQQLFAQLGGYVSVGLQNRIFDMLQRRGISCLRAPFSASAQLACFAKQQFVHAVFGGLELLLMQVQRVIVTMNVREKYIEWVSLEDVLNELKVDHATFVQLCLVAGFDSCRTLPGLLEHKRRFFFESAIDAVKQHDWDVLKAIDADEGADDKYLEMFHTTLRRLQRHIVVAPGRSLCRLTQSAEDVPESEEEVRENTLSKSVYALLATGVLTPHSLSHVLNGMLLDTCPLIDSEEYAELLHALRPLRNKVMSLTASALEERYHRTLTLRHWFAPEADVLLPYEPPTLSVSDEIAASSLEDMQALALYPEYYKHLHTGSDGTSIECVKDAAWQRVLSQLLSTQEAQEFHTELLNAALLLRLRQLNGVALRLVLPDGTLFNASSALASLSGEQKRPVRLLCRVATLLSPVMHAEAWSGGVDRELAAFLCVAKMCHVSLRNAAEASVVARVGERERSQKTELTRQQLRELCDALPSFPEDMSAAEGILAKCWLLTEGDTRESLATALPQIVNVATEVDRIARFFKLVAQLAESLLEASAALQKEHPEELVELVDAHAVFTFRDALQVLSQRLEQWTAPATSSVDSEQ